MKSNNTRPSRGYLTRHLLRSLLGERETISYPQGPLELPDYYRGRVVVDVARCRGCGLCARNCPTRCVQVERSKEGGVRVRLDHARCATCGLCELVCRYDAIRRTADFVRGAGDLADLVSEWARDGA